MVNFLLGSYKKGGANKCIFQFFLLMLRISLEILIFRHSAQILLENALFCRQNARPQNRLFARNSVGRIYPSLVRRAGFHSRSFYMPKKQKRIIFAGRRPIRIVFQYKFTIKLPVIICVAFLEALEHYQESPRI